MYVRVHKLELGNTTILSFIMILKRIFSILHNNIVNNMIILRFIALKHPNFMSSPQSIIHYIQFYSAYNITINYCDNYSYNIL